jgi:perosamine synthetase
VIPWFSPHYWGREKELVLDALDSTWISDGRYIRDFEKAFGEIHGSPHCISVSNGTTALHLALLALGIGPGDEVIVPGFTFSAPANMVLAVGATPIFADIDEDTWCLSLESMKQCLSPKTRAIIPVHLYGNVCDIPAIRSAVGNSKIAIVEDVAEAAFSRWNGQYSGTLGDIGCFSFQATKTLTMGEGGAVLIKNPELADRARLIRNHGMRPERRYWHEAIGHNFRLTNMQAALGCGQLEKLPKIIAEKNRVLARYQSRLTQQSGIRLQKFPEAVNPVLWAFAVRLMDLPKGLTRDEVQKQMISRGVETRPGFFSFSKMPLYNAPALPVSEMTSESCLSLPSFAQLEDSKIDWICEQLLSVIGLKC